MNYKEPIQDVLGENEELIDGKGKEVSESDSSRSTLSREDLMEANFIYEYLRRKDS
jgi:hypothetical protein